MASENANWRTVTSIGRNMPLREQHSMPGYGCVPRMGSGHSEVLHPPAIPASRRRNKASRSISRNWCPYLFEGQLGAGLVRKIAIGAEKRF